MNIMSVDDDTAATDPKRNWKKPSKAVLAYGDYDGCVLWTAGPHLDSYISEGGLSFDDLGLDPPEGISVWEGVIETVHVHTPDCNEYDTWLTGTFREPTDDEWAAIRRGKCPWDESDWDVSEAAETAAPLGSAVSAEVEKSAFERRNPRISEIGSNHSFPVRPHTLEDELAESSVCTVCKKTVLAKSAEARANCPGA